MSRQQSSSTLLQQFPALARSSPFAFRNPSLLAELQNQGLLDSHMLQESAFPQGITLYEQGSELIVKADVPGFKRDEIEVMMNKGVLTIRTERKEESREKKGTSQRRYWSMSQSRCYAITLPLPIDEKNPSVVLDNGVLTLTFQKAEKDAVKRFAIKEKVGDLKNLKKTNDLKSATEIKKLADMKKANAFKKTADMKKLAELKKSSDMKKASAFKRTNGLKKK